MDTWHRRLIVAALISLLSVSISAAEGKETVGWVEEATLYPGGLTVRAKLDTGARNSSLNAPDLRTFERNGEPWVSFSVTNKEGASAAFEQRVHRTSKVKRTGGGMEMRPVVMLGICLDGVYKEVEVSLVDQSNFIYQLLIGRSFLRDSFLIDPSLKYTRKPACSGPVQ